MLAVTKYALGVVMIFVGVPVTLPLEVLHTNPVSVLKVLGSIAKDTGAPPVVVGTLSTIGLPIVYTTLTAV